MNSKLRTTIGILSSVTPPFLGFWVWYLWWAEPKDWDYQGKLIEWMSMLPPPSRGPLLMSLASWDTPYGELILWNKGDLSLHSENPYACLMPGFNGGVLGRSRMKKLAALCESAILRDIAHKRPMSY